MSIHSLRLTVTPSLLATAVLTALLSILSFAAPFLPRTQAKTDCAAVTDVPQIQCEALVALYASTDGSNWFNRGDAHEWNTTGDTTVCDWYGVTCDAGDITQLSLSNNHLSGEIPATISSLTSLTSLRLDNNYLSGLPASIGNLTNLQMLSLSHN